jgi:nucleoside-diphosphate-sugar epimerase
MTPGKKVLLVGGAGFIGHHLALELTRRGAVVEVVDGLTVNNLVALGAETSPGAQRELYVRMAAERLALLRAAGIALHVLDARDRHALSRVVARAAPNTIVQLAAVSHAGRSNQDPGACFEHSLRTLQHALDAAREAGVQHFVYFSSSMVYGHFRSASITEDHPLDPLGVYGALKLAGEKMVLAHRQVFGLPYTIVRPSALYGPRCVGRRVAQVFIENALAGRKLRIEGDGSERLDFTCVDDLVDGTCRVVADPAAHDQVFNLTYGQARSVQALAGALKRHFPEALVEHAGRDALMPLRGTLCIDRARALLGYAPRFALEAGLARYVAWYREFLKTEQPAEARVAA